MAQNIQIDPVKKDYVFENGSPVPSDRTLDASYFSLMIPQGKYLYGQNGEGSLLYTLQGIKRTASVEQRFSSYAKEAIRRQVIDTGKATDVEVSNYEATRNGTSNIIKVTSKITEVADQINFVGV